MTRITNKRAVRVTAVAAAAMMLATTGQMAGAQNRPVTIVVPFAAGGGTDITTRAMQQGMGASLGVDVVVRNAEGAGGTIGVAEVARARPDGTTVAMAPVGPLTTQPHMNRLPYDIDSFSYVCLAYSAPTVIAVRADSPFETLEDLVEHARANPGDLNFAVQAIGSIPHVAGLGLAAAADIEMTYLPVNGDGPALRALLDGSADLFIPHVSFYSTNAEQLKSLALLQRTRLDEQPDLMTASEQGYDLDFPIWGGLVTPAGTPPETLERLEVACDAGIRSDEFQGRMEALGQPPAHMGAADFEAFVRETYATNRTLLEAAGLISE